MSCAQARFVRSHGVDEREDLGGLSVASGLLSHVTENVRAVYPVIGQLSDHLPPDVHAWLRRRAKEQGRSMSAETVAIPRSVQQSTQSEAGRRQAIDRRRAIRRRARLGADAPPAEELIRADRERSG